MARKQIEVNEAGFRLCSSEGCENMATHWYVWTNEPVMQCPTCVQRMMGSAQAMGHLTPVATVRLMTVVEMQPAFLLEVLRHELLSRLSTAIQEYNADGSESHWDAITRLAGQVVGLKPDWVVREQVEGIS